MRMEWVVSALCRRWQETFPSEVPTIYPGEARETESWKEWVELHVENWEGKPGRAATPVIEQVRVAAHLFTRQSSHAGRMRQLTEAARTSFDRVNLVIRDPEEADGQVVGMIRLGESRGMDWTNRHGGAEEWNGQHELQEWSGLAVGCVS